MSSNPKWAHLMNWKETWRGFDVNPQNIVPWRPRKLFRHVNDDLKAKWIEPLTKEQLIDAYALIFNTDEEALKWIADDKNVPYVLRLIIKELNDKKARARALADYRDYMFGKAIQTNELTWKWGWPITLSNILSEIQWIDNK